MKKMRVTAATFAAALVAQQEGRSIDEEFLASKERSFRSLKERYPCQVQGISHKDANPPIDTFSEIDVELTFSGVQRVLPPIDQLVEQRMDAIRKIVLAATRENPEAIGATKKAFGAWMRKREIVRIIGAGRALLAASAPANRLAHGGATVSILNDSSPSPNSRLGGGIVAVSASGETKQVLQIMEDTQRINKTRTAMGEEPILVIGFSNSDAVEFASLCTAGYFVGIRPEIHAQHVELKALGDLEEYAISELFDALVVAAGLELGVNF